MNLHTASQIPEARAPTSVNTDTNELIQLAAPIQLASTILSPGHFSDVMIRMKREQRKGLLKLTLQTSIWQAGDNENECHHSSVRKPLCFALARELHLILGNRGLLCSKG